MPRFPHLAFILVDDMGYNDFYLSTDLGELAWPQTHQLAKNAIKLDEYYTQPICTPTRGAFMTGRYPARLGLQHSVIDGYEDYGLPADETTLADKLRDAGYRTYAVGKWHIGCYSLSMTPASRGFDSFFGYFLGAEDHWTHTTSGVHGTGPAYLDLQRQNATSLALVPSANGTYDDQLFASEMATTIHAHKARFPSTPAFFYLALHSPHAPLQSPGGRYDAQCAQVANDDRRTFCAMAAIADDAIGNVSRALAASFAAAEDEYLVVVSGDNGGLPKAAGNNFPLRGEKATLGEGGVRNHALVFGSAVPTAARGTVYAGGLVHVTDWHVTFASLGGASLEGKDVDGYNVWPAIISGAASPRTEMLLNYDPDPIGNPARSAGHTGHPQWAYRMGEFKLLQNVARSKVHSVPNSSWSSEDAPHLEDERLPPSKMKPPPVIYWQVLFNVSADPTESRNLSVAHFADVVRRMQARVKAIVNGSDYRAPCNVPYGKPLACFFDVRAPFAVRAHGGWYPWSGGDDGMLASHP